MSAEVETYQADITHLAKRIESLKTDLAEAERLLEELIPDMRSKKTPCWCAHYHDLSQYGHTTTCTGVRAFLARRKNK